MNAISKRPDQFIETDVDDEVVIVGLVNGQFFSLKDSGLAVWKLIDGKRSTDDIVLELRKNFAGNPEEMRRETDEFLGDLRAAKFIV